MKRKFITERGAVKAPQVRQSRHVLYTIDEAIEIFIRAKTAEGVRPGTIKGYHDIFRYFREWLDDDITEIHEIKADTIRNYINYLRTERTPYAEDPQRKRSGKGLSVHTINIRIRGLSAFFRFLSTEGIIPDNPTVNISQVRDDQHEEVPGIPDEQIDTILAAYDDRQFAQWRDKTLILLLLDTGLRIGEALSLTSEQINFKDLTVTVPSRIAKNRKSREIPISREVAKRLRQLLDETQQYFGEDAQVFMNAYGGDFTDDAFRRRLNRLKRKLNIPRLHPHMFRHTFARNYVLNGGDIFTLQRILDHAEIETTRKYVQMDNEHIREQHNKFSPVRNIMKRNGIRV
ncbi:tyrosine-type recombinase/integrase [Bacillus sp. EB106-08-02-XG196]|uniref:tyrosine-type recombinase/integrase n=1 Tax=Bacillus sp. EB106-08-02-XG196 TaxID=2737049 RepID=UPI0015C4441C|nr:tyrosine-type recombinase/integrase [Bacillus sp. EB106-08-02-XG196]NWQ40398.1 tyrosine-type recombinase/integrase [Bacillus sp. EB106-08-02-XG196]